LDSSTAARFFADLGADLRGLVAGEVFGGHWKALHAGTKGRRGGLVAPTISHLFHDQMGRGELDFDPAERLIERFFETAAPNGAV